MRNKVVKESILIITVILSLFIKTNAQQPMNIAAAADLRFAMDSIVSVFKQSNAGAVINITYGSSGQFTQQIENGAPFDLFFSANTSYPQQLKAKGHVEGDDIIYGKGQIVVWSKKLDPNKAKINSLLDASVTKISIANPEHAPYGKRAQESLVHYGLYNKIKDKLVVGENIAQAAQYITSGAADIGIIALSLARSPNMQDQGGKYWVIPDNTHQPLVQGFVMLTHAGENNTAKQFATFFSSVKAKKILEHFGIGSN